MDTLQQSDNIQMYIASYSSMVCVVELRKKEKNRIYIYTIIHFIDLPLLGTKLNHFFLIPFFAN